VAFLRARPDVAKVSSLGWCFGGGQSLKLVMAQPDLAAGVIYYGGLESDPAKVKGLPPLLGIFGKLDQGPSQTQVAAFDAALTTAGVTHEIYSYDGAGHAFANPTGGDRYKPEAAADAWAKTLAFLAKHAK
jgi:carboxymethylenebutenolidase